MHKSTSSTMTPAKAHLDNSSGLNGLAQPNAEGFFLSNTNQYGGAFLPPKLLPIVQQIASQYDQMKRDPQFLRDLSELRQRFIGRPSPVYECKNLSEKLGGARIYLKREDLNHTGSYKMNHCLGEALLAKRMGKTKLIAETGAGQHGVAVATVASLMQMDCEIHMGERDIKKEWPNVRRMQILGATVVPASKGAKSLKEALDSAFETYLSDPENMFFAIGSAVGPHPYPSMLRDFQAIVGYEAKEQFKELTGGLPDMCLACIGGGCNSLGLFTAFLDDEDVKLVGVESAGRGLDKGEGNHAATLTFGKPAVLHGMKSYTILNDSGDTAAVHSVASGLGYPSVGPQHSLLKDLGRVQYETATDEEVINAFFELSRMEGIIPALESAHGLAYAMKIAKDMPREAKLLVNLSGRGDKDLDYVCDVYGDKFGIAKEGIFLGPPQHDS
ncbi:hypothetical protein HJC23_000618 [Cyclotella cryptica]|uniref:tryptophan synthase n=1 Tax=Cyclotella cryptica TaxID=29204 RepID=A0ABD3Q6Z6_9STRA|eukprot:CCRYP_008005-RA/>CCRYP_008005-RA protein AED:0.40 eAED:0.40 QI:188/1/1/1/1/1/3/183/442